jgi:glycerol-3-phosphate dehydrogenase
MPLLLPIYKCSRRGRFKIRSGMLAYDLLSWDKTVPGYRLQTAEQTQQDVPGLRSDALVGSALYYDAQVEFAERLVVENILSAVEHGATVRTYSRVTHIAPQHGDRWMIQFRDELTSELHEVTAEAVVNASGPWVDELLTGLPAANGKLVGGTKGSHIVVARFPGASQTAIYVEAQSDHRPFFIIPWNGHYLIGTTDFRFTGNPDEARIDASEIAYLLRETNHLFPEARLDDDSILFTFSGVRPLAFTDEEDEQSITRRHFIRQSRLPGLISLVGGKLTTYRRVAEETVDLITRKLRRKTSQRCTTAITPLPGAVGFESFCVSFRKESPFPQQTTERLLRLYGTRAAKVVSLAMSDSILKRVVDSESGGIAAEVVFAFDEELAQTLCDVLTRRTLWAFNSRCGFDVADEASRVAQMHFNWQSSRVAEERSRYEREMVVRHQKRV